MSRRGGGNFFDDDDTGGFGGGNSSSSSRNRGSYDRGGYDRGGSSSRGDGYDRGGYEDGDSGYDRPEDYQMRMQSAYRRMEDSSANSLRVLNETMNMGVDTTVELDRQQESLDRTERRLDEIHVDLDRGETHLRKIRSPFGGLFSRKKKQVNEVTDPKELRAKEAARLQHREKDQKERDARDRRRSKEQEQQAYSGTGSAVVDKNLDEMEKMLHQLHGVGEMINDQLDESDATVDRLTYKMDRDDLKMKKLNKGIKRELYK